MAVTFPDSPVLNQSYQAENGLTYIWDGEKWSSQSAYNISTDNYIRKDGSNTVVYADNLGVGIGTTSPAGNLHVQGATGNPCRLYLTDGDEPGTGNSFLLMKTGLETQIRDRQPDSYITLHTQDTEQVRIDPDGNVGIKTTDPACGRATSP